MKPFTLWAIWDVKEKEWRTWHDSHGEDEIAVFLSFDSACEEVRGLCNFYGIDSKNFKVVKLTARR